jgi:hypothetical protein
LVAAVKEKRKNLNYRVVAVKERKSERVVGGGDE